MVCGGKPKEVSHKEPRKGRAARNSSVSKEKGGKKKAVFFLTGPFLKNERKEKKGKGRRRKGSRIHLAAGCLKTKKKDNTRNIDNRRRKKGEGGGDEIYNPLEKLVLGEEAKEFLRLGNQNILS